MRIIRRYTTTFDELIHEKGYSSIEEFTQKNPIHRNTLYSLRKRTHTPRLGTLSRLAESLDMDLRELISRLYPEFIE